MQLCASEAGEAEVSSRHPHAGEVRTVEKQFLEVSPLQVRNCVGLFLLHSFPGSDSSPGYLHMLRVCHWLDVRLVPRLARLRRLKRPDSSAHPRNCTRDTTAPRSRRTQNGRPLRGISASSASAPDFTLL